MSITSRFTRRKTCQTWSGCSPSTPSAGPRRGILALRDSGNAPCTHVSELIQPHLDEIERRLAELRTTRTALRELAHRAARTEPNTCSDTDMCSILTRDRPRAPRP